MRAIACGVLIIGLLLVGSSAIAQGSWEARLRVIPEGLGLQAKLLFDGRGGPMGRLFDLEFELRNVSAELVKINWDGSSLQLPGDQRWHVVNPEVLDAANPAITVVPAESTVVLRICPVQTPPAPCDSTWLQRARLNEDFSLTLRLAVSTLQGPRMAEWRWDFDYHEEAVPDDPPPPDRSLSFIVLAAAVVIFALLLLR